MAFWSLVQIYAMHALLLNIEKSEAVGVLFPERAFAEGAI